MQTCFSFSHRANRQAHRSLKAYLSWQPASASLDFFFRSNPRHTIEYFHRCHSTSSTNTTDGWVSPTKAYDIIPPNIASVVEDYARQDPTIISLGGLIQKTQDITKGGPSIGRLQRRLAGERGLMSFAQLLKHELPIRLAHRIQDLDQIPHLRDMPSVQTVKGIYIHSFQSLLAMENPTTPALETEFGHLLHQLYQNHSQVLLQMAKGVWEFKTRGLREDDYRYDSNDHDDPLASQPWESNEFLNRFYSSRVGIRVLAGQYLAVRQQWIHQLKSMRVISTPSKHYIGMICQDASPYEIVQSAIEDATRLCTAQFGHSPKVVVKGRLDLTFPYIPTHLHYIVLELLKNALRATVEHHYKTHGGTTGIPKKSVLATYQEFPDVVVVISDSTDNEDVVIRISDQGGGIPRSQMSKIWSYLFTTANPQIQSDFLQNNFKNQQQQQQQEQQQTQQSSPFILAGLGYGLPMSRAYARYFGGDLDIISMEGFGTDVRTFWSCSEFFVLQNVL
jgi:pyruvate dehydrogenase kinase 2/3/4